MASSPNFVSLFSSNLRFLWGIIISINLGFLDWFFQEDTDTYLTLLSHVVSVSFFAVISNFRVPVNYLYFLRFPILHMLLSEFRPQYFMLSLSLSFFHDNHGSSDTSPLLSTCLDTIVSSLLSFLVTHMDICISVVCKSRNNLLCISCFVEATCCSLLHLERLFSKSCE